MEQMAQNSQQLRLTPKRLRNRQEKTRIQKKDHVDSQVSAQYYNGFFDAE